MAGQWRRLLPGHATSPAVGYDLVRRRRRVWAPRSWAFICSTLQGRLADGREVVVKRCPYPAEVEADGLAALAAAGAPVPAVLGVASQVLVLERVGGPPDWPALGWAIARLHRTTGDRFGWHRDNFQGMTVQPNGWCDDWPGFYVERRIRVHLADPKVPEPLRRRIDRACDGPLPALLRPRPPASLTHGDLWAANVVEGRWLVDPAVSFADRELELAYMQLSSSLPAELLDAYLAAWPLDPGYEQRRPALQLHKFLNNSATSGRTGTCPGSRRSWTPTAGEPTGAVARCCPGRCSTGLPARTSRGVLPEICQKRRLAKPSAASPDLVSPTPFTCDDVMQRKGD